MKDLVKLPLLLPPLPLQVHIAACLQRAKQEVALHQERLSCLQAQQKGLMQQLLTGQVRLLG